MSEYQIEMRWRCSACSADNLGRHMVCQRCGDPKEEREAYVMPGDTSQAAQVKDEKLLTMATAGANWACAYCGSDQRNLDGSCGRCGAGKATARAASAPAVLAARPASRGGRDPRWLLVLLAPLVMIAGGIFWAIVRVAAKPHTATVTSARWIRDLHVERRELVTQTGFVGALPEGALDVADAGLKVHHEDRVFDHMEAESYTVTVPDGTRTESYSSREACGQTCTTSSRSCTKSCTPNKNGFASCKDVCTGGTQTCSTRYCDVQKTRQVPKTRQETRTRQVERFRMEPRYAPALSFRAWAWVPSGTGHLEGSADDPLRWPEVPSPPLADGGIAETREQKTERFQVELKDSFGGQLTYVPKDEADLRRFGRGATFVVGRSPSGEPTFTPAKTK